MTRPLRIGYLVPQFPGQTHIFFWRELRALEAMGHEVHVLSTRKPPAGLIAHDWSNEAMARTTYLGRVHPGEMIGGLTRLVPRGLPLWIMREGVRFARDAALAIPASEALLGYARKHELDHIHVHSCARAALVARFAHSAGGPPYSLTLHGPLSDYGSGQRFKWRAAAFATVITRKLLEEVNEALSGDLPERVLIRPMGVDTDVLKRGKIYSAPEHGRPIRLFSCGRLNIVKGHQDVMSSMRQLLDQGVDVRLEIAGEDDDGGTGYRKELEAHLKKLRLQDHVKLLGAIDAGTVQAKLEEAHLFVLASWHEPLGVAYMEAMSMEVPTIGTDAGGVRELITSGENGILVEPKKPTDLARTIRDLAADPERLQRLSKAGRAHVVAHYRSALGAELLVDEISRIKAEQAGRQPENAR
ncbi:exopolysaccharide biosynthesis GT4 family glycosyltransferase EpsE [Cognatishimia sp. F0-27]|uniref:exopolysaccharide biosynthesis GT4 family glycosyltransferase EpsE n=1 Tax=Cognatishimia sp. F0-27 TaxID=2816855 RepID=UPI001D0C9DE5|nr:glycosyltransferase family 4 protein [Cognatishimia sp. F0-27]